MSRHTVVFSTRGVKDVHDDQEEVAAFANRGCCFCIPLTRSHRSSSSAIGESTWWQRIGAGDATTAAAGHPEEPWWSRGWRRVREWSEQMTWPRWKTLVRRFRRNRGGGGDYFGNRYGGQFRYDALSYAMNFDDGHGHDDHLDEEDYLRPDFSSRYASIPCSIHHWRDSQMAPVHVACA